MTPRSPLAALALAAPLLATVAAHAQTPASAPADPAPATSTMQRHDGLLTVDYQVIKVPGDEPIDLLGFHVFRQVAEGIYLGAGAYGPHLKGEYGGFMAFDLGAHVRYPLGGGWLVSADLSGGGGGGGRNIEQSSTLSGTGGFVRAAVGLAYDFGPVALGINATRMKFRQSLIDGTQANVFLSVPFSYRSGAFALGGRALTPAEERQAASDAGESMLTFSLDNLRQIDPQGTNQETIRTADLQYAHFLAEDTYWFAALGIGYRGLPMYNQMMGGLGQRVRLSRHVTLYGQLGIGTGGYAPELIDTGPGLLIYPKASLEYALSRSTGLALSVGYLAAPEASSRNHTVALAFVKHWSSGDLGGDRGGEGPTRWQGVRFTTSLLTDFNLRYRDIDRDNVQMISIQFDTPLSGDWYLPVQASVATSDYRGYPGYGEVLAGVGRQTQAGPTDRWQLFGELMAGAIVHGLVVKANAGVRYQLNDQLAAQLALGHIESVDRSEKTFSTHSLGLGLSYRFSLPVR